MLLFKLFKFPTLEMLFEIVISFVRFEFSRRGHFFGDQGNSGGALCLASTQLPCFLNSHNKVGKTCSHISL